MSFDFSPQLDFFLQKSHRGQIVILPFKENQSAKHLIESLGVPHTEIRYLTINNEKADMTTITNPGDHVVVYSVTDNNYKREPLQDPRFILDNHLGTLARYLRLLGFDCFYENEYNDETLALISRDQDRVLLSRDRRLLMRSMIKWGYCLRSLEPIIQLEEVMDRYMLYEVIQLFGRCPVCNFPLEETSKEDILDKLQPLTIEYFNDFKECQGCGKIYWNGSHVEKIIDLFKPFLTKLSSK